MSWLGRLYETYNNAIINPNIVDKPMPIYHTKQNAHINIVLDGEGNFKRASLIGKYPIVIPATEFSAGRTSGASPHALADNLMYVAGDLNDFSDKKSNFNMFIEQLEKWCNSTSTHSKVNSIYKYINKKTIIKDLCKSNILFLDINNKLISEWSVSNIEAPENFKDLHKNTTKDIYKALICWSIEILGDFCPNTWEDCTIHQSWIDYQNSLDFIKEGYCSILGIMTGVASNHPAKLRNSADSAKLISSNDNYGFTFRGKFTESCQACSVSIEASHKAHNALRWLIERQGGKNGDQVIIAWALSKAPMTKIFELIEPDDWSEDEPNEINKVEENNIHQDMGQLFANKLNKKIKGYMSELGDNDSIVVMALDSASPGRMSMTYYREFIANDFFKKLESWYKEFLWIQEEVNYKWRISTPSPKKILETIYGKSADSVKRNLFERLLPCIIEGRQIPQDLLISSFNRAINPNAVEKWEWRRNIWVACSLYRGYYNRHFDKNLRKDHSMGLDLTATSRDYLYGRLLAIAESIEEFALNISDEKRITNSERLMQSFANKPFSTWLNLEQSLQPYLDRLKNNKIGFFINRKNDLDEVMNKFNIDEFKNDKKLTGEFLLAYHCQRHFYQNKNKSTNNNLIQEEIQ